jgi:SAM-dependent methyltransferase
LTEKLDRWASGTAYDRYVGRWSRRVAAEFIPWLGVPADARWLDVGSGTGGLTETILTLAEPASVVGVDPSDAFVAHARAAVTDPRATFRGGSAAATGITDGSVDAVVSGLVLNFVPDVGAALDEACRVVAPGGVVGAYVWDYADGMEFMRLFWDAAIAVDPGTADVDQGRRFPVAAPGPLGAAFTEAGLRDVSVRAIEVPTVFPDFDDLWTPFLGGTGSAPTYVAGLTEEHRQRLREQLRRSVPQEADGSIRLRARTWAASGRRPGATRNADTGDTAA